MTQSLNLGGGPGGWGAGPQQGQDPTMEGRGGDLQGQPGPPHGREPENSAETFQKDL